jgi:chitodextrinase
MDVYSPGHLAHVIGGKHVSFHSRRRRWLTAAVVFSVGLTGSLVAPSAAKADVGIEPTNPCLSAPEDVNRANIRLDEPAEGARLSVDENGKITVKGVLHKKSTLSNLTVGSVVTTAITYGPPPTGVSNWASSWTATVRPPHLGSTELCALAWRDPKWTARILRHVTVVDLIPPSAVPGLTVGSVTSSSAKVSWDAATDNYGLAGYDVSVDGGAATRTTVGTRTYSITGLSPSTSHTVSVVAVDLAGNRSATPATTSFTTKAPPPPPDPQTDGGLTIDAQEGHATATWHPDLTGDVTYQIYLDGKAYAEFPLAENCRDAAGNPANPCTAQDVISYSAGELDGGTPYQLQIKALAADGTQSRMLSGTFTTPAVDPVVPVATTGLIASESSRCAGLGGAFYVSPSQRGRVQIPAGSIQLFDGCYTVVNSSCIDQYLPVDGNDVIKCSDDVTTLLYAVAPPGRGPAISSMEAVAGYLRSPSLVPDIVMEPVTWCTENIDVCIIILESAPEAVEVAAAAATAFSVADFLVIAAEGIGLGLALWTILEILFPGEINIAGLLEYPIDHDVDFGTFKDWGLDHGRWYNSLKMYAEVIKTTKQVAESHDLPFVWTDAEDRALKIRIDNACGIQRGGEHLTSGCDENVVVYVPGGTNFRNAAMQETGRHIVTAMSNEQGGPYPAPARRVWYYPAYSRGGKAASATYKRDWYDTDAKFNAGNACTPRDKQAMTCDEFPFWSTNQAVDLSGTLASLKPVPMAEKDPQRDDLSGFYGKCMGYKDGTRFIVLPIDSWVEANGPSFGFRVNQGGASLCMEPKAKTD